MKKRYPYFLLASFLCCISCADFKSAKGDAVYGGTLRISETDRYTTLYPAGISEDIGGHIANQIYEGLVRFDMKDLSIIPAIAEKWEIDPTGTIYTFTLHKGIHFQDDSCFADGKGRELTAQDVKYSFELLCTDIKENTNFSVILKDKVVGANEFYNASKGKPNGSLAGVEVIDEYTVRIKLLHANISFLNTLAIPGASIVPKEAIEKYGLNTKVGTGAFLFHENDNGTIILTRNPNYYRTDELGNQLPFLDSVVITVMSKTDELAKFQSGELALVTGLPSESVTDIVTKQIADFKNKPPKYILERLPEMANQYYEFNLIKPPFTDVRVRKAFSYAIDRNKIVDEVLNGEAYGPAIYGFCPPSIQGYDITKIKGYDFAPDSAKKYLAQAGYPNGKDFPKIKIELNSGGTKHIPVVAEIQKQLKNVLNIDVDFEVVTQKKKLEDAKFARAEIVRSSWIADFPSPESFLFVLYGGTLPDDLTKETFPNTQRYKNPVFDSLYEAAKTAKTQEEAYKNYMEAEQLMMKDAPIMMLWYAENYRMIKSNVHNLFPNPIRYRDYARVYLKELEPKEGELDN
ncbi:MAG TPA: ABC transporter substrate-binding protein [Bacteroidia bacterium]|jgi:peptide/nickel transport system substrate-binding protein|nr:ABC transporter substrate-binding protein [Bacteroidia bacterium]